MHCEAALWISICALMMACISSFFVGRSKTEIKELEKLRENYKNYRDREKKYFEKEIERLKESIRKSK